MDEQIDALQQLINTVTEFCVNYSFQVVGAIIVLIIGFVVANSVQKVLLKGFEKKGTDITLSKFLAGIVKGLIVVFAVIIAMGKFGITIAPFIAALSAIAFGASLAIQGPVANYGAGITIILTRPFVVGDTITVAEVSGVVEEVKLACTTLRNEDGIKITIPNKHIVGEIVHNSAKNKIVEAVVGISYDADPAAAIKTVEDILTKNGAVVQDPKPQIGIQEFADSSVNIGFRYWVPTVEFFKVSYAVNLEVYKALQSAGITIPYPQRDIHIVSQPAAEKTPSAVS